LMMGREMPTRRIRMKATKSRRKHEREMTRWWANGKWKWSRRFMAFDDATVGTSKELQGRTCLKRLAASARGHVNVTVESYHICICLAW